MQFFAESKLSVEASTGSAEKHSANRPAKMCHWVSFAWACTGLVATLWLSKCVKSYWKPSSESSEQIELTNKNTDGYVQFKEEDEVHCRECGNKVGLRKNHLKSVEEANDIRCEE